MNDASAAATKSVDIPGTLERLRATFDGGRTRPIAWRRGQRHRLRELVTTEEKRLLEALKADIGSEVVFDRVLMLGGDDNVKLGAPTLDGMRVRASVVEHGRHDRVVIYRYRPRQNANRRRGGHRQAYTAVKIEAIET